VRLTAALGRDQIQPAEGDDILMDEGRAAGGALAWRIRLECAGAPGR
jgi:hypothetical protein